MSFQRGSNPVWLMDDLTGHLLDDTFYMFVLQNTLPYFPATVYHDSDGTIPWNNPIQFYANGTLPVDIFFDNSQVYRIEIRQGNTQSDPLIYLVENYSPGAGGSTPVTSSAAVTENQITNPQFSTINFRSPYTLTGATDPAAIELAPGWFLELLGTGNVGLEQVPLNNSASTLNPTNAPYALRITLSGTWTLARLHQRFDQNGMNWANKTVASSVTARIEGTPQTIEAILVDSNGTTLAEVLATTSVNSTFNEYLGYGTLGATTNPDVPPDAYIDYILILPTSVDIYVTSFQLVAQDLATTTGYQQETVERHTDHTFHYYKPQLEYKPIPSYAIGWDFPFNPGQALGTTINIALLGANKSRYIADQTIAFEAVTNVLNYTLSTPNGLQVFTNGTTQFAIIQYLDSATARELLEQRMSVRLKAKVSNTTLSGTVSLYWTTDGSLPNINTGTNNSLVATMTSGKAATFNGNWTEVERAGKLGSATFTLTDEFQELSFNYFDATAAAGITTASFFAIVIGFDSMPATQALALQYVTLNAGDIATPPAPMSRNELLTALQYYYEKSYNVGDVPATLQEQNSLLSLQSAEINGANVQLLTQPFNLNWQAPKRTTPSVNLFSPSTGLGDTVRGHVYTNGIVRQDGDISLSANWSLNPLLTAVGTKNMYFVPSNGSAQIPTPFVSTVHPFGFITYHYVADARFGIV